MGIQIFHILVLAVSVLSSDAVDYVALLRNNSALSEDGKLDFLGLAAKYCNFSPEVFSITTPDGYILSLFHIAGDKSKPVLLSHGDTMDPDCFIVRGETSLACTLAKLGYDVWVIAYRGTIYSQRHVSSSAHKDPKKFFNYSFHEKGIYDYPTTIDFILKKTNNSALLTIGYSVGCTINFVCLSQKPEYNKKVKAHIAMAPVVFEEHQRGAVPLSYKLAPVAIPAATLAGASELLGRNQSTTYLLQSFCITAPSVVAYNICVRGVIFENFGPDDDGFEQEFIDTHFGHYPAGSTRKQAEHYVQVHKRNKFALFDYGTTANLKLYGTAEPPDYNLTNVVAPTAILVGDADYLSSVKDTERLKSLLPNATYYKRLDYESFNHFDFVFGQHIVDNLYPDLLPLISDLI